jgi:hypothetical protein
MEAGQPSGKGQGVIRPRRTRGRDNGLRAGVPLGGAHTRVYRFATSSTHVHPALVTRMPTSR